ncbi:carbamoyltransferase C-terminal domain-containing protein [Neolewinella lacunae]|uniref:Carbamoyltransferase n=1 Tax=Neolewinella lacunae TaxID=1517758 RepID=A0A923PMX1_9BACT|nr:carbamoyltransferase C-terminal domain-containing protein [Neolewinella lacunae]MBC6994158.1 carbamoyltransferase [Neolewinella lacunae]MDN3636693.1 carbamoyltransferase C-terminal domain-containing protein [Neolewinella lacunae]
MFILGLNAYHADSSAAIFKDGIMIAATEEERFRRVKHWAGFPSESIKFCLREAGISIHEVDHIAIGRDPKAKYWQKIKFALSHPLIGFSVIADRMSNAKKVSSLEDEFAEIFPDVNKEVLKNKIHQVEHHRAHLASAFFASPYEEAALLSIDGSGDFSTTMIGIGRGSSIEILDSIDFPNSLGIFYSAMTQFLGFHHYGDEYKVMGLAPYGVPKYVDKLAKMVKLLPNGLFELDLAYFLATKSGVVSYGADNIPVVAKLFSSKIETLFGKPRIAGEELTQDHKDIAASVQKYCETVIMHILQSLQKRTGLTKVCIAGGVAQNSVANGKITSQTDFTDVYIPSAGHDAGISMGAALFVQHQKLGMNRLPAIWSAYTGAKFSNEEIEAYLKSRNIEYQRLDDEKLFDVVTDCLLNAGVVGWFQGRAEFGPRALGARSILADPRRNDAKEILNSKIKRRESFRPFAPSILENHVEHYFEKTDRVPFMEKVFLIKKDKQAEIPAVTHVDGTGRLQSVNKDVSPRYYKLIEKFREKSGVPILLNTSFNENEPIVNSPEHALDCYLRTKMDMLVLENIVISRS